MFVFLRLEKSVCVVAVVLEADGCGVLVVRMLLRTVYRLRPNCGIEQNRLALDRIEQGLHLSIEARSLHLHHFEIVIRFSFGGSLTLYYRLKLALAFFTARSTALEAIFGWRVGRLVVFCQLGAHLSCGDGRRKVLAVRVTHFATATFACFLS